MPIAQKVFALLHALTKEEIEDMPPFIRRQFAERCRHLANIAEPAIEMLPRRQPKPADLPRSGVLYHLRQGERAL